jgi:hypothetical protein
MNNNITPTLTRAVAREKYRNDIESWKNFAQRITKNPFTKTYLFERDGEKCAWCQKPLYGQSIIHHVTYEHCCTYPKVIRVASPTENNPFKTRVVPDCKSCKENNSDRFMACMSKVVLVHNICNKKIAESYIAEPTTVDNRGSGIHPII